MKRCYENVVQMQHLTKKPHFVVVQNIDFPTPEFDNCQTCMYYNDKKDRVADLLKGFSVENVFLKFNQYSDISSYIIASESPLSLNKAIYNLLQNGYDAIQKINITNL